MKAIHGLIAMLLLLSPVAASADAESPPPRKQPNIIFVLTDDQRSDATGFASGGAVWSPGMDKLRSRGMQFSRAYAGYSLCSPSRAAILSGQYGSRNGVNALGGALNRPQDTFVNALRNAGYQTAVCGKWHLETKPKEAGFDWAVTFNGNGTWYGREVIRNGVKARPPGLVDAYCADESVRFLRERDKTRPFILWHCSQLPHMNHKNAWPASQASLARYEKEKMPTPPTWEGNETNKPAWLAQTRNRTQALKYGYGNPSKIRDHTREYRATIGDLDDALQPLWAALDADNLWANTVVIFMSDNGWMLGEHGLTSKVLAYDPSARIPLFIAGPGIEPGSQCDRLVSNLDIAPTVLDFAGLAVPGSYQGHSLRPLLTDPQTKVRDGFIYEGTGGYGEAPRTFAWITERTKVIHTLGSKPDKQPAFIEIYDMKNDPDETNNLSSSPGFAEVHLEAAKAFEQHDKGDKAAK